MSALETYIMNATAIGAEVSVVEEGELASRIAEIAGAEGIRSALLAGFGGGHPLRALAEEGLVKSGVSVLPSEKAADADLGVTLCETLVADTGSLAITSRDGENLQASLLPRVHLAVGRAVAIHPDMKSHLAGLVRDMPSRLVYVTGPSRTGDIEATMTRCVHGPGRVVHLIVV